MSAILSCTTAWWWWYLWGGYIVSDSESVIYPFTTGLHHQHIVSNLGASVGLQSPIKQPDHSDKVTDLMHSDIIK